MRFDRCTGCSGFLPPGTATCPNCSASRRDAGIRSRAGLAGGILGGGAIAFTLMACSGMTPCAEGTNDCYTPLSVPPEDAGGDASYVPPSEAGDAATQDGGAEGDAAVDGANADAGTDGAPADAAGDGSSSDGGGDGASDSGGD